MKYFLLLFLCIELLSSGERMALLIGNTQYKFQPLSNPINDVRAIKKTLIEIGFKKKNVITLENASQKEIIEALNALRKRATKKDISLIYFSGHGIQVNEINYMFPANTTAQTYLDIKGLIKLDNFIDSVTTSKYGIVLIDACRNNPLIRNFQKRGVRDSRTKGLAQIIFPSELDKVIIGFPTRIGELALDGHGENSPYAKSLAKNLKFNLDIRPILSEVSREVYNRTKNNIPPQIPEYKDTFLGREGVCLTGICTGENPKIEHRKPHEEIFVEPELENINIIGTLMYQREPSLGRFTWYEAKRYCKNIKLKGYSNWRLPTKKELNRILKQEEIGQKEIHLWTYKKDKESLVWAVDVDERDWYRSDIPKEWKNPNLCVRKIKKGERR